MSLKPVCRYQEHSRALCRHKNPTDLPTYPNLSKASVVGGGKGTATLYNAATQDAYQKVLARSAWMRAEIPHSRLGGDLGG